MTIEEALLALWFVVGGGAVAGAMVWHSLDRFFNPWVGKRRRP